MSSVDIADDIDLQSPESRALCATVRSVLDRIADKWTIMILTVVCSKPSRFNQIKRRLDGITHKALADALKRLERNGLVMRTVLPTTPIGVEYRITPLGASLQHPFEALYGWAIANEHALDAAQSAYDQGRQAPPSR